MLRGGGVCSFCVFCLLATTLFTYNALWLYIRVIEDRLIQDTVPYVSLDIPTRDEITRSCYNSPEKFWFIHGAHTLSPSPGDRHRQLFRLLPSPFSSTHVIFCSIITAIVSRYSYSAVAARNRNGSSVNGSVTYFTC